MPELMVSVNGHGYRVVCADGEEAHVGRLGEFLDERVGGLARTIGQVGEARLLVMAALVLADELSESAAEVRRLRDEVRRQADSLARAERALALAADRVDAVAGRVDDA